MQKRWVYERIKSLRENLAVQLLQANLISTWHAKSLPVTTFIFNPLPKSTPVSLILLSNTSLKSWATSPCSRLIICGFLPNMFSSQKIMGHIISLFIVLGKPWKNICGIKIISQHINCIDHTSYKDIKSVLMIFLRLEEMVVDCF